MVDDPAAPRIVADRHAVAFEPRGARVDVLELLKAVAQGVDGLDDAQLEALARMGHGEFLEGFELPDFLEFQAWLVAAREQARDARCQVLAELTRRLRGEPARALGHAHAWVQADPLSIEARIELLELLVRAGRRAEASQQLDVGCRLFREIGAPGIAELQEAFRRLCAGRAARSDDGAVASTETDDDGQEPTAVRPVAAPPCQPDAVDPGRLPTQQVFVGRVRERDTLLAALSAVRAGGTQRVVLITGDPGVARAVSPRS